MKKKQTNNQVESKNLDYVMYGYAVSLIIKPNCFHSAFIHFE